MYTFAFMLFCNVYVIIFIIKLSILCGHSFSVKLSYLFLFLRVCEFEQIVFIAPNKLFAVVLLNILLQFYPIYSGFLSERNNLSLS